MKELILKNKYYYTTILVFMIAGAFLLFWHDKLEVTLWVNNKNNLLLDRFLLGMNLIGDVEFAVILVGFIFVLKGWRWALKAGMCFTFAMIVTQFMKHIIFPGVLRPTLVFPEGTLRLVEGVIQLKTESFPSGHTSSAFSIATFLALYKNGNRWNMLLAFLALLVAYGRIYFSQHFITDVYCGMIIGVAVTTLIYYYYPKSLAPK